jgi:SulP family sulfate permease
MSFGAAKGMARRLAQFDEYDILILEFTDVPQIDFTTTRAVYDMVQDAQTTGRQVFLVGGRKQVYEILDKQGVLDAVPKEQLVATRLEALRSAIAAIRERQATTS